MNRTANRCRSSSAKVEISLSQEGSLQMTFIKSTLNSREIKKHFYANKFQIVEPYILPDTLTTTLGIADGRKVLLPGYYLIRETPEHFIVIFE